MGGSSRLLALSRVITRDSGPFIRGYLFAVLAYFSYSRSVSSRNYCEAKVHISTKAGDSLALQFEGRAVARLQDAKKIEAWRLVDV